MFSLSFFLSFFIAAIGASGSLHSLMSFLIVDRLVHLQANRNRWRFIIVQLLILILPYILFSIPLMIMAPVQHSVHICGALLGFLFGIYLIGCPFLRIDADSMFNQICRRIALILLILYYVTTTIFFFLRKAPTLESVMYSYSLNNQTILDLHEIAV